MKSYPIILKRAAIIIKVLLIGYSVSGQILSWGDQNSANSNHSVVSIVEATDLIVLGKATDKDNKTPKVGYSKISLSGQVLTDLTFTDKTNLIDLNSIILQPDGLYRVYGTAMVQNGITAEYMNCINPKTNSISNNPASATVSQYSGEAKLINKNELIQIKSVKSTSTNMFNIQASRIKMGAKDVEKKNIAIVSKFNEEPKTFYVLPDTSFIVLGKRDVDQTKSKSFGVLYCISPDFKIKWNMQVLNGAGLTNQNLTCGKDGWIYYFCSTRDNNAGTCSSKGFIFDKEGNKLRQIDIDSINVNAILTLKNGNILIAGYKIQKIDGKILEKAHYVIYDRTLKKVKSRTLGSADKPEVEFTSITNPGISSEYTTGIQLATGKIVLGGRANLPINVKPDKMQAVVKANKYLIAILSSTGDL